MTGLSSCDNEEFLNVTHYSILEMSTMYESDANAKAALNGCYDLMLPSNTAGHNGDPFKPYLFTGSHPTMASQATGWDKAFMTQSWNAQTTELSAGWNQAYAAITRSNDFLSGLGTADKVSDDVKRSLEGEARALRASAVYRCFLPERTIQIHRRKPVQKPTRKCGTSSLKT